MSGGDESPSPRPGREHPGPELSAYADGELSGDAARRVRGHVEGCTECARELALIQAMGDAVKESPETEERGSVWEGVHRRLTRPAGWALLVAGILILTGLATVEWLRAGSLTLEWLATTAVVVGGGLLVVSIGYEQYREWKDSPYRDVQR